MQIMETFQEEEDKGERVPNFVTYVNVQQAHESDAGALLPAIEETQERECGPTELLADALYGGDENVEQAKKVGVDVIAPTNKGVPPEDEKERLRLEDFELDEETGEVRRCPAGEEPMKTGRTPKGTYTAQFDRERCAACEWRDRCPVRVGKRTASLTPYDAKRGRLAQRRRKEKEEVFREKYRWRAGIEATNARLRRVMKLGRLRVRGLAEVRYTATLKVLGWNIWQAVRAKKARIVPVFRSLTRRPAWRSRSNPMRLGGVRGLHVIAALMWRFDPILP